MVKIEAFVEVSARRLRSLQPTCPHGISIGKNCDEKRAYGNYFTGELLP
jgi:hypothetical protein